MTGQITISRRARRLLQLGVGAALAACLVQPAAAQELTHRFVNPSFGGNPFYSEHLLAIATIHRPAAPTEETEDPPTEEELLAAQLRSQFLAQLSSEIRTRILTAQPGDTGSFDLGTTRISFIRRGDQIEITFLDTTTGEESRLVIPASDSAFASAATTTTAQVRSSVGQLTAGTSLNAGGQLSAPNVSRLVPSVNATASDAESRLLSAAPGL